MLVLYFSDSFYSSCFTGNSRQRLSVASRCSPAYGLVKILFNKALWSNLEEILAQFGFLHGVLAFYSVNEYFS